MTESKGDVWVCEPALRGGFTIWTSKWDKVVGCIDDEARYGAIESERDAKLIAAAPQMLKALEGMVALWVSTCKSNGHQFDVYSEYIAAMEVLKKAKGEQA